MDALAAEGDGSLLEDPLLLVLDLDVVFGAGGKPRRDAFVALPLEDFDGEGLRTAAEVTEPAPGAQALDRAQIAGKVVRPEILPDHARRAFPRNFLLLLLFPSADVRRSPTSRRLSGN